MAYINVYISKPCRLSVRNKQLVVLGEEEHTFPLEDLNAVLIETGECMITAVALRAIDRNGETICCYENHCWAKDCERKACGILSDYIFIKKQIKTFF